ncbi:ATP-binding protein [Aureivirga sp. CE67]|uniref:tetratricopeptide repeat-containing sensor histidine kinase n=1 Tax=Aureivirga sp. CE67 TaxID=1788983 RepID=UPI0018CB80DC|nr:ATP-binding protein [Aureivirga sp. CE67]
MKKYLFYFLCLLFYSSTLFSQQKEIEDVPLFFKTAHLKLIGKESENIYKKLHYIYKNEKDFNSKIKAVNLLNQYHSIYRNIDSSKYYNSKFIELIGDRTDELSLKRLTSAYNSKAISLLNEGLIDESIKWHIEGLKIAEKINFKDFYYRHLNGLALCYTNKNEDKKAVPYFEECLNYKEKPEFIIAALINLALIYSDNENYTKSNNYLFKAIELSKENNQIRGLIIGNLNLGGNYLNLKKYQEALDYLNIAKDYSNEHNFDAFSLDIYLKKAMLFREIGENQKAKEILWSIYPTSLDKNIKSRQLQILKELELCELADNNKSKAYDYLVKYTQLQDEIDELQNEKEIKKLEIEFEAYRKEKEIQALQMLKKEKELVIQNQKKAYQNLELENQLKEQSQKFEIEKLNNLAKIQNTELELLQKKRTLEKEKNERMRMIRIITIISISIILIFIFIAIYFYLKKLKTKNLLHQKQEIINQQKIESLIKNQEIEIINASLEGQKKERERIAQELHDTIGGNIAAIKLQIGNLIQKHQRWNSISKQINHTYEQVRDLSHSLMENRVYQGKFSETISNYIQNIENSTEIEFHLNLFPEFEINNLEEKYLVEFYKIIQELISNTLKHANAENVEIHITLHEDEVSFIYEDDGKGFELTEINSGLGLKSIEKRTNKLNGISNIDAHPMRGFTFSFTIPLKKHKEILHEI